MEFLSIGRAHREIRGYGRPREREIRLASWHLLSLSVWADNSTDWKWVTSVLLLVKNTSEPPGDRLFSLLELCILRSSHLCSSGYKRFSPAYSCLPIPLPLDMHYTLVLLMVYHTTLWENYLTARKRWAYAKCHPEICQRRLPWSRTNQWIILKDDIKLNIYSELMINTCTVYPTIRI